MCRTKTETPPEDEATNLSSQTGFASANTSLVSTYRNMGVCLYTTYDKNLINQKLLDSDSEADYESATENEVSFTGLFTLYITNNSIIRL